MAKEMMAFGCGRRSVAPGQPGPVLSIASVPRRLEDYPARND